MNLSKTLKQWGLAASMGLCTLGVNAQAINESFDDITTLAAAGWVTNNLSTPIGTTNWFQGSGTNPFAPFGGTGFIVANFNNVTGANTISNWLITPSRTLNNGDVVTFYTRTTTPGGTVYPDRMEVRLSLNGASTNVGTTNTSVGDFTTVLLDINPTLTTTGYPNVWTQYTLTVSGLPMPMTGRMAFRYFVTNGGPTGTNSDAIGIDNFVYTPAGSPTAPDMDVTAVNGEYTQIPLSQAVAMNLGGTVANGGTANATNAMITAKVYLAPNFTTPVQTTTSTPTAVNMGANAALTAGTFTPSAVGDYVVLYLASATGDANAVNDSMVYAFSITDDVYARDENAIASSFGIGAGPVGHIGWMFQINATTTLDSVMGAFIKPGTSNVQGDGVGDSTRFKIFNVAAGLPTTELGSTGKYVFTAADTMGTPTVITLGMVTPLTLNPGTYFVAATEYQTNVGMAVSNNIFKTNTVYAGWVGQAFTPVENFGANFAKQPIIRPMFGSPCSITASGSVTNNVSCNGDADGSAMASASGGVGAATYIWDAAAGNQTTATATGLAAGVYSVTTTAGCSDVASVTITEPTPFVAIPDNVVNISCNGGNDGAVFITVSGGTPTYTYLWSNGATTDDITGLSAGIYSGTATDANGCVTGGVLTITEPSAVVSSALDNADGTATANATGGTGAYIYQWDAAAGNQTTATATGLFTGTYGVTVTDANGCSSATSVAVVFTGIDNIATLNTLNMFPNPTTTNVFVDLDLTENQDVAIRVLNVTGQTVLENNVGTVRNQRVELATSELPTGVYMVQFFIGTEMTTRKLVVDKR